MNSSDSDPPLVFANRVIQRLVGNLYRDVELKPEDCTVIRLTYRRMGGTWASLVSGSHGSIHLLTQAIKAWKDVSPKKPKGPLW